MSVNINHQLEQVNNLKITPVGTGATVGSTGIVTYYGDGSQLSGISGGGGDAATLDGIDSTQFLRSDAADIKNSGDLTFYDDVKIKIGNGEDLNIYHDSSNGYSIIDDTGTGDLVIKSSATKIKYTNNLVSIAATDGVELYKAGFKKFETTSDGVIITGIATATSFVKSGGTSSQYLMADGSVSSGGGGGGASDAFKTIAVSGQSDVVADSATDTLTLVAGSNMTITTNASGDSITFASSGGGSGGSSSTRSVNRYVATNNQTLFPPSGTVSYTVGYIDVYLNGSKLDSTEFTASNGTTVTLTTGASANDIVELVAYTNVNLTNVTVVNDTTPQLGGDLDLNGNDITGSGNISINGNQVATQSDAIAYAIALG